MPRLVAYETVASTSDVARRLAEAGAEHGSTVVADHQTAGRGRHGREWLDRPREALLLSMVLRPAGAAAAPAQLALPLLVGLACARAIRSVSALAPGIEWPNDLVLGDAKVGGILCEGAIEADRLAFVVAGVGINIGALAETLDDASRARATSLAMALGGRRPDRADLARAVAQALIRLRADAALADEDVRELRALDSLRDRRVRFGAGREGVARGILPDGALLVDCDDERLQIRAGSVTPIGPRAS